MNTQLYPNGYNNYTRTGVKITTPMTTFFKRKQDKKQDDKFWLASYCPAGR